MDGVVSVAHEWISQNSIQINGATCEYTLIGLMHTAERCAVLRHTDLCSSVLGNHMHSAWHVMELLSPRENASIEE